MSPLIAFDIRLSLSLNSCLSVSLSSADVLISAYLHLMSVGLFQLNRSVPTYVVFWPHVPTYVDVCPSPPVDLCRSHVSFSSVHLCRNLMSCVPSLHQHLLICVSSLCRYLPISVQLSVNAHHASLLVSVGHRLNETSSDLSPSKPS